MASNKEEFTQQISQEFEGMSNTVLAQLDMLSEIFASDEGAIPGQTIEKLHQNEENIDAYEIKLEKHIINAIVLYKPVASELRKLFSMYQMVINLERIGDRVIKIANFIGDIKDPRLLKKSFPLLRNMLSIASEMVNKALLSFVNNDQNYALWTIKKDAMIDELNHNLLKNIIKEGELLKESQEWLTSVVDIRAIISSIERIGDQATNIAEASIYALSGTNIKHQDIGSSKK